MKILVTGGAGYIGSHTVKALDGHNITVFDRIENHRHDCRNSYLLSDFFDENRFESVIHFAASKDVNESVNKPTEYYSNNIHSLINILYFCEEFNVKKLIFSSSCSVYGNQDQMPVDEDTTLNEAQSPYAYTKQVCERMLKDYCKANPDFTAISLRYFNPAGSSDALNPKLTGLIPQIALASLGKTELVIHGNDYPTRDGTCIRDFVHVSDIADAHVKALDFNQKGFHVFNLGTGTGITVLEAVKAFEKATGRKVPYTFGERREGDIVSVYSDNKKAKQILGWEPKLGIEEIMLSTLQNVLK